MTLSNLNRFEWLISLSGKVTGRIHKLQASKYCLLGDSANARRHVLKALIHDPFQAADRMLISIVCRILLGNVLYSALKRMLEKKAFTY
jgi:hypothetical protein